MMYFLTMPPSERAVAEERPGIPPISTTGVLTDAERKALDDACRSKAEEIASQLNAGCRTIVSAPFVIGGDLREATLQRYLRDVVTPTSRALKTSYFDRHPNEPIVLLIFSNDKSFREHALRFDGADRGCYSGYYQRRSRRILLNIASGEGTLAHELTHALAHFDFPEIPEWFDEGLASLHEECAFSEDGLRLNGLKNWRRNILLAEIRAGRLGSIEQLMSRGALFAGDVLPVLRKRCFGCHGDGKELESGLDLRTRAGMLKGGENGTALVPGRPDKSPLYQSVLRTGDLQMPPKERNRLTKPEIAALRRWVAAGAPWGKTTRSVSTTKIRVATSGGLSDAWTNRRYDPADLWAYRPIQSPSVPGPADAHPIDSFIRARLKRNGLQPAPLADKRTLLRRVTLDLTGLPPTPDEMKAFLADDSKDAYRKVVDRLLNSPRYGEQQARHWLDVVRYADTAGFSNDFERPNAWRYRDYVIRSFNADKPFDRFIIEQIAGDELNSNDPELLIATGFFRMGPWEHTGMSVAAVTRQQYLDDVTHAVGVTFLGQGLRCAKCHDHKFDPVPTRDYYRIQAIFAPVQFVDRRVDYLKSENISGFDKTKPRVERLLQASRDVLASLREKHNKAVAAFLKQHGYKRLQDVPEPQRPKRHFGLTPFELSLDKIHRKRVSYFDRELKRYRPLAFSVYNGPFAVKQSNKSIHLMPPPNALRKPVQEISILTGGSLETPGEPVSAGVLSAVHGSNDRAEPSKWNRVPQTAHGRRLAFARWIASPENALTGRVIVNRIWQQHFTTGLVATPNNFGKMGAKPTHPELLDWLATRFTSTKTGLNWSIKRLHRLIVTSHTYRQSTRHPDSKRLRTVDPKNRLLAAYPPRRLAAEELRDAMLAVTGELNTEMGGPGVYPEINWEVARQPRHIMGSVAPAYQPSPTPAERNRRTIYAFRYRTLADPMLEVFNRPNSDVSCERRDSTTITPQVFALFNGHDCRQGRRMTDTPTPTDHLAGGPSGTYETFARMARLSLKELRETLRDRRTILTLVLMPLLVYPLLSLAFQRLLLTSISVSGEKIYLVAVESSDAQQVVETYLANGQHYHSEQRKRESRYAESIRSGNAGKKPTDSKTAKSADNAAPGKSSEWPRTLVVDSDEEPTFRIEIVDDLDAAVSDGRYDLGIRIPAGTDIKSAQKQVGPVSFEMVYRQGSPLSRKTLQAAERSFDALNNEARVQKLEAQKIPRHMVPALLSRREVKGGGSSSPYSLAAMIPLILILMTITGAVYPAIDLTAGERERGTLEMLVAAPVPRIGLLLAKYSAVLLVAMMTATVNLVGMTLTIVATGLGPLIFGKGGFSPATVASVFGLMLLFAAFFSAVLLVLTSFARSFKEAQAYLIPLMLVAIAPGILSVIPDIKLTGLLTVTPLANIVLLARDLFLGEVDPVAAGVVVLSTFFYAGAALSVAAKIFGTDAILYGSHGTWSDLFRRPSQPLSAVTVTTAMMTLAFLFPGFILLGQFVAQIDPERLTLSNRLLMNGFVLMLLFGAVPYFVAMNRRVRMNQAFALSGTHWLIFPGSLLLGVSLFPFVFEILMWTSELIGSSTDTPLARELAKGLVAQLRDVSPFVILAGLALAPALFEEFFFRGFLLSAFRVRMNDRAAIVASAALFGVFHVVVQNRLAPDRMLPSTLMGLILGWVCVRSGSLFPGMILHAFHNGLLLMIAYYQPELIERGILTGEQSHIPIGWLAAAAGIAATGFILVWLGGKLRTSADADEAAPEPTTS
eukprot:g22011.t1